MDFKLTDHRMTVADNSLGRDIGTGVRRVVQKPSTLRGVAGHARMITSWDGVTYFQHGPVALKGGQPYVFKVKCPHSFQEGQGNSAHVIPQSRKLIQRKTKGQLEPRKGQNSSRKG